MGSKALAERFAINLAAQPLSIPDVLGNTSDPKKITDSLCEFRQRLSSNGHDKWWAHDATQDSMDAAVQQAASVYASAGRGLFTAFDGPDAAIHSLTPAQLERGQYGLNGFGSTKARMALALARMRQTSGRLYEARAFAAIGLAEVGNAGGLRRMLEDLGK